MKQMKSYRMDDTILGMIDWIKEHTCIKTDTRVINEAITWLYYSLKEENNGPTYLTIGVHHDK